MITINEIEKEEMKNPENIARGKKSRRDGKQFEKNVRIDLESKGWIVDRWSNNLVPVQSSNQLEWEGGLKMEASKHKFRGCGIPMALGTGFPDYIAFKLSEEAKEIISILHYSYEIIGVEVKSNGKLSKEEKMKLQWYLDNKVFSEILIAEKDINNRGCVIYKKYNGIHN